MNYDEQIKNIDPDIQHYIFQKGVQAGIEHQQPSPKTLELFEKMDKRLQKLDAIHHFIFGVEGKGGLATRFDNVENDVNSLKLWQKGVISVCAILTAIGLYYVDRFDKMDERVTTLIAQSK